MAEDCVCFATTVSVAAGGADAEAANAAGSSLIIDQTEMLVRMN